jgi:hypothetical protein
VSVTNPSVTGERKDWRVIGSFVYMLLCQDSGPIYVKIGLSDQPLKRAQALRNGCPVAPRRLAICAVPSRFVAKRVESCLLLQLRPWRAQGEWFKFEPAEKPAFNQAWSQAFSNAQLKGWPLQWTHFPLKQIVAEWERKQKHFQRMWKRRGRPLLPLVRIGQAKLVTGMVSKNNKPRQGSTDPG